MKGFFLAADGIVQRDWIDRNLHLNMAQYLILFNGACDFIFDRSGLAGENCDLTFVASRVQMSHRREVLEGDAWQIWSGYASVTEHRFTLAHRLTSDGIVRATCEVLCSPFSLRERASVALDADQMERAVPFVIAGLADPFAVASPARPAS